VRENSCDEFLVERRLGVGGVQEAVSADGSAGSGVCDES
jgi:hypothetical protein